MRPRRILVSAMLLGSLFPGILVASAPTFPRTNNNFSYVQDFPQPATLAILCWTHHQETFSNYLLNPTSLGSILGGLGPGISILGLGEDHNPCQGWVNRKNVW